MHREEMGHGRLGFTEKDFKVCDLCGALNRIDNEECFVCGWYGAFHHDPDTVRRAISEFEAQYGGLNETLLAEELLPSERHSEPGFFSNWVDKIKTFLRGW